jgi:hypothetical protein
VNREIWSSPLVYRRASKTHSLGLDGKAFNTEATRRVKVNVDKNFSSMGAGDRILSWEKTKTARPTSSVRSSYKRAAALV